MKIFFLPRRQWKLQRERLQADFTKALDNFQRAQRSAAQKEKEAIKKYKNQGVSPLMHKQVVNLKNKSNFDNCCSNEEVIFLCKILLIATSKP